MYDVKKDTIEHIKEIDNAIRTLKCCQYCWADQVAWEDEVISDYDAITQVIKCLKRYKDSEETSLATLPQEQEIETEIDIKQGISEQSKKWEDGCNAYNQEHINKLAEEIKAKQEELRSCDEISNIVSSEYKAL